MTLVQTQQRLVGSVPTTVFDALDTSGPRVGDDITVEVALFLMASARVEYLLLCDQDEHCTGSVTRAQLAVVRDSPAYTDRVRVRDVLGAGGPHSRGPGALALTVSL
ncbi:CBS domain-containing protein [Streptomyces mirabilis]|uniref:CBS domain-containing protein n=1 Tax=Streptomyces mirabilis TaxID=68239 RepID=UPI00332FF8ED